MDILKSYGYKETRTLDEEIEYVMDILIQNKSNLLKLKQNALINIKFK
jgi:hypothetical protein